MPPVSARSSSPLAPAANASAAARSASSAFRAPTRMRSKRAPTALSFRRRLAPLLVFAALLPLGCYYAHLADGQARRAARAPARSTSCSASRRRRPSSRERLRARRRRAHLRRRARPRRRRTVHELRRLARRPRRDDASSRRARARSTRAGFWFPLIGARALQGVLRSRRSPSARPRRCAADGLDTCLVPRARLLDARLVRRSVDGTRSRGARASSRRCSTSWCTRRVFVRERAGLQRGRSRPSSARRAPCASSRRSDGAGRCRARARPGERGSPRRAPSSQTLPRRRSRRSTRARRPARARDTARAELEPTRARSPRALPLTTRDPAAQLRGASRG